MNFTVKHPLAYALAVAVGSLLLLAACGASAPTKAQYTTRANAVCQTTSSKTTPLTGQLVAAAESLGAGGGQRATSELAGVLGQLDTAASDALSKLRALSEPSAGHAAIEQFLTPLARVTSALGQAAHAAASGQPQTALGELKTVAADAQQLERAAAAYGLTRCETVLAPVRAAGELHPMHATLTGENHDPTVNQPWSYTVTVTGAQGQKPSGTETTHYTYNGMVVGTEKPENVKFTAGVYHDTIAFPAAAVGMPLDVQVTVHTSVGSATLSWPIDVKR